MNRTLLSVEFIAGSWCIAACADNGTSPGVDNAPSVTTTATAAQTARPHATARPQDDMYRAVNGEWLAKNEIPADRPAWGAAYQLRDDTLTQLASVIEDAGKGDVKGKSQPTADQKKIADLYASFMDEPRLEALGAKPIAAQLVAFESMVNQSAMPTVLAPITRTGLTAPSDD